MFLIIFYEFFSGFCESRQLRLVCNFVNEVGMFGEKKQGSSSVEDVGLGLVRVFMWREGILGFFQIVWKGVDLVGCVFFLKEFGGIVFYFIM